MIVVDRTRCTPATTGIGWQPLQAGAVSKKEHASGLIF